MKSMLCINEGSRQQRLSLPFSRVGKRGEIWKNSSFPQKMGPYPGWALHGHRVLGLLCPINSCSSLNTRRHKGCAVMPVPSLADIHGVETSEQLPGFEGTHKEVGQGCSDRTRSKGLTLREGNFRLGV